MMSGASHDGIDSAAEPTVLSRPGTCVTSLLDVLEGSQRVARGASAAPSVAPSVAPSIAGDLNDDTRSEAGSVATLPPTDLTWEKDSHTGVNAKDAADPGEPAPGEPRTVTLKRLAEAAAAAHASVAVGGGGGSGAHFSANGADSPAGSDSGIGSGVTATTTADGEHNRAVVESPGDVAPDDADAGWTAGKRFKRQVRVNSSRRFPYPSITAQLPPNYHPITDDSPPY
jgi:hypothetical protein